MKNIIFVLIVSVVFHACNEDRYEVPQEEVKNDMLSFVYNDTISFLYKEKAYISKRQMRSDSTVVWENETARKLYEELEHLPNLFTYIRPDGVLELYDTADEYFNKTDDTIKQQASPPLLDNPVIEFLSIHLYEHNNGTGQWISRGNWVDKDLYQPSPVVFSGASELVDHYLDDKISSIRMYALLSYRPSDKFTNRHYGMSARLFEGPYYEGRSIYFHVYSSDFVAHGGRSYTKIFNLDNYTYKEGTLFTKRQTWNDRVSSYLFYY